LEAALDIQRAVEAFTEAMRHRNETMDGIFCTLSSIINRLEEVIDSDFTDLEGLREKQRAHEMDQVMMQARSPRTSTNARIGLLVPFPIKAEVK
jgi:hypothetical protein